MFIDLTWLQFKNLITTKNLRGQFVEDNTLYKLFAFDGPMQVTCLLNKDSSDETTDFEDNFKSSFNFRLEPQKDADGAQIVNPKFAGQGRTYQSLHFELTLGKSDDFVCKNYKLEDNTFVSFYHYKSEEELLEPGDADSLITKSVLILAPQFDYDIQGFCLYQKAQPTTPIKMWAVMVPFLPPEYGGPKELISCVELSDSPFGVNFLDYVGDSATTMKYQGQGSNEMMLVFRFPPGTQHKVMGEIFWYV